jgi:hypothetical protein
MGCGLSFRAEISPGFAGVMVLQRPAALFIPLGADELQGICQARVFALTQRPQAFHHLQEICCVGDWYGLPYQVAPAWGILPWTKPR